MNQIVNYIRSFVQEEDGAQIIEYALIVAVVSLGLILLIQSQLVNGGFTNWITRVSSCLTTAGACQ